MQTCRMFADVCSVCTIWITIKLSVTLNLHAATLPTPENDKDTNQTVLQLDLWREVETLML